MKVFLDANILFSAVKPRSRIRALVDLLLTHGKCVSNAYAVEEARRNLALKGPALLGELQKLTEELGLVAGLTTELDVKLALKDVPILGGAVACQCTHLLTGDQRDFGPLFGTTIQGVRVVSPQMLAEELVKLGLLKWSS